MYLIKAISIALRYSASRMQFKDDADTQELPILEYQSQQYKLLPHLVTAIVQGVFTRWFAVEFSEFSKSLFTGEVIPYVGNEIHGLSSAAKPVCTWAVRDAIQDCRESAGGHGYLKGKQDLFIIFNVCINFNHLNDFYIISVAGFGDLRDNNDPNCTYEGENNVLLQQASNWLLSLRKTGFAQFKDVSPLKSADYLHSSEEILKQKWNWTTPEDSLNPQSIAFYN